MTYPRIYSLSTAGILRHYNKDYLIHKTRTDFTGSNGVGKSMIADFFQIIFIPYRKYIEFGTEGINNNRLISNLPYEVSEAYTFLNIQVAQDKFITLGTCISKSKNRSPTPFLILNDVDTQKKLQDLSYSKEHIPLHTHFIENDRVVDLNDLAKHFRDKYQLSLITYGNSEKKNEFFSLLYNKEILPINLSIEDNLKAFAKVIQSFSRAKSLDVNDSKSLKSFLFEDEGTYDKEFKKHEEKLQNLLQEYKLLEHEIESREQKQTELEGLKKLEEVFKDTEKQFFILNYKFVVQAMKIAQEKYKESKRELDITTQEMDKLETRKPKLERILQNTQNQIKKYKEATENLRTYIEEYKELQLIKNQTSDFIILDVPDIQETIKINEENTKVDITQLEHKEILQRITAFKLVYQRYGSFAKLELKYHQQYETLGKSKRMLTAEIQQIEKWINLFSSGKGLFANVLKQGKSISEEQEAALFHLIDVHWQQPYKINEGVRYTDNLQVLDIANIDTDEQNNGFWLKLGHLREFFPKRKEYLLKNPVMFKEMLKKKTDSFKEMLETPERQLAELKQFELGEVSTVSFLQLDPDLRDATSFNNLKNTAFLIQNLDKKIDDLHSQEQVKADALRALKEKIPFFVKNDNIEKQELNNEKVIKDKETRHQNISLLKTQEDERFKSLSNEILLSRTEKYNVEEKSYQEIQLTYHEKENERLELQIKIDINEQESIHKRSLEKLEKSLGEAKMKYQDKYRDISTSFPETNKGDPEIKEQIEENKYNFQILESVLLGPKIKYFENLPSVLLENNRTREKFIQSIYTSMLRIFSETKETYENQQSIVRGLNGFFRNRKISGKYVFHINFNKRHDIDIDWIDNLNTRLVDVQQRGQLPFGESVDSFVEGFFKQVSGYRHSIDVHSLLDPKTYFNLSVSLKDENDNEYSGSTGETYSAIVLLGIGRLSRVQKTERKGLRFVILEETANLDQTNFNHFPEIARDFGYQIITMTPQPYGSSSDEGWYLYHLLPSKDQADINSEPLGYFKTNRDHRDLRTYLNALENSR